MTELTKLDICKKIAAIEGVDIILPGERCGNGYDNEVIYQATERSEAGVWVRNKEYNPLTNKALLFDLMVKYDIYIDHHVGYCFVTGNGEDGEFTRCEIKFENKQEIPHAVLLAIIEVHDNG